MQTPANTEVTSETVTDEAAATVTELKAFANGEVITLKEVNDGVFSEGIMGDGFAIIPEDGTIYAPADAKVELLMQDSRHACGLRLANDAVILLHIGIDTVAMQGDGFEYLITQGQEVKAGAPLIKFDKEKIKAAGYVDTTVCVITETGTFGNVTYKTGIHAYANKTVVAQA